jgi:hypothetical protein
MDNDYFLRNREPIAARFWTPVPRWETLFNTNTRAPFFERWPQKKVIKLSY